MKKGRGKSDLIWLALIDTEGASVVRSRIISNKKTPQLEVF
ncbi:hypothetical protein [Microcoleus sp.]